MAAVFASTSMDADTLSVGEAAAIFRAGSGSLAVVAATATRLSSNGPRMMAVFASTSMGADTLAVGQTAAVFRAGSGSLAVACCCGVGGRPRSGFVWLHPILVEFWIWDPIGITFSESKDTLINKIPHDGRPLEGS